MSILFFILITLGYSVVEKPYETESVLVKIPVKYERVALPELALCANKRTKG